MPLKRITANVETRRLGHLRLWRDDLEEMVRTIRKAVPDVTMTVDGDYSIDEVSDLREYGNEKLNSFSVEGPDMSVHLTLSDTRAQMTMTNPNLDVLGVAAEIERIAATRRRRVVLRSRAKMAAWISLLVFTLVAWYITRIVDFRYTTNEDYPYLSLAFVLAGVASSALGWMFATFLINRHSDSAIIFAKSQQEAPPWFKRNKDSLTTNAIVSFVFFILGIIVGYVIPK